jgi:TolA-binding protein
MRTRPLFHLSSICLFTLALSLIPVDGFSASASESKRGDDAQRERLLRESAARSDTAIDFDAQASVKRDAQIAQLQKIIPRIEGEPRADLLFRLAELWWEKSRIEARQAILRYDAAMSAWLDSGESKGEPEPRLAAFLKESELFRHEALRTYRDILDRHPTYARRDEVLFADAYNKAELGRRGEAIQGYVALLTEFPSSRFAGDAQVQLGEHYFEQNQLQKAREAYEQALGSGNPSLRSFARYKLAWCDYNAGDDAAAIARLKEVVVEARAGQGETGQRREALNDIVLGFARLDATDEAMAYLQAEASEAEARRLIARLAALLLEAGHHTSARKAFGWLIESNPNDPRCPEHQRAIITSLEGERERGRVQEELRRLAENYGPKSAWAAANAGDTVALERAAEIAESAMRTLVTDYHGEAQRTKSIETYAIARDIYRDYLDLFPDSPRASELRFFYAEILWALGEFEAAGPQYAEVARRDPNGEFTRLAAYDAMLCYERLVDIEHGKAKRTALKQGARVDERQRKADLKKGEKAALLKNTGTGEGEAAEALTSFEAALVEAIDRFVERFPGDEDAIGARYKAAFLLYERHHDVAAARRLGDIIEASPRDAFSRKAVELSLNLLERRAAWRELHELARKFRVNAALVGTDAKFGARLQELSEASLYKHLDEQVLAREGRTAEAAQGFSDLAKAFPESKYAPQALFYALALRTELVELDQAIELGTSLLSTYPNATRPDGQTLVPETWRRLAKLHEQRADLEQAADAIERSIELTLVKPDDALADALLDAALYREGLGHLERAARHAQTFVDRFPERPKAPAMALKAAGLDPSIDALRRAREKFGARLTPVQKCLALAAELRLMRRPDREADRRLSELLTAFEALPADQKTDRDVLNAVAGARFEALEPEWQHFEQIDFTQPQTRRLKAALVDKAQRLESLEKRYLELIALGAEDWTLAALTRLGQLSADFAQKLLDSPDPPELSPEELDIYRGELEARAFPLEEKAIQAFEAALAKAFELELYDRWVIEAGDALNRLRPGTLPPSRSTREMKGDLE